MAFNHARANLIYDAGNDTEEEHIASLENNYNFHHQKSQDNREEIKAEGISHRARNSIKLLILSNDFSFLMKIKHCQTRVSAPALAFNQGSKFVRRKVTRV
jgi:hypothetical protein